MLGTGKSFRTAREGELIRDGYASASLSGEARLRAGSVRLSCTLTASASGTRKLYALNGQSVRYAAYLGRLRVVTFVPARLAAGGRRAGLAAHVSQRGPLARKSRRTTRTSRRYGAYVSQKSALLRGAGAARRRLARDVRRTPRRARREADARAPRVRRSRSAHKRGPRTAPGSAAREGELELHYAPNVPFEAATPGGAEAAFRARLAAQRAAEALRKSALVGPHRDDLEFRLDGKALAAFGSQGQQRTAVLALKVAEYALMSLRERRSPDSLARRRALRTRSRRASTHCCARSSDVEQAFLTTTSELDLPVAATYRVEAATLREVA